MSPTILIVDDDASVRRMAHEILLAFDYRNFLLAEDAAEALRISAGHPTEIHLLLSDINMPGELDGRDLGRKLHEERPETKVLLMSGDVENDDSGENNVSVRP